MRMENKIISDLAGIRHIAIIADGNGRWAKQRMKPRVYGHKAGADNIKRIADVCLKAGLPYLSVFTLSTENLKRPKEEIDFLFSLVPSFYKEYANDLRREKIGTVFCGSREELPSEILKIIDETEAKADKEYLMKLIICFNYGGRDEIARAFAKILAKNAEAGLKDLPDLNRFNKNEPSSADLQSIKRLIAENLYLPNVPAPDLIIRTAGEMRLSNFWLWQAAYSEFFSSPVYWPDFGEAELAAAIDSYRKRERKFGLIGKDGGHIAPMGE